MDGVGVNNLLNRLSEDKRNGEENRAWADADTDDINDEDHPLVDNG